MSKKKDFEEQLLEANTPLRRNRKMKKNRRDKIVENNKHSESLLATDSSIDGTNDAVDVEEDLCVVEEPASSNQRQSISNANFVEMSAADKLKSQANKQGTMAGMATGIGNSASAKPNKKRKTRRGSGTSSEEERWLDAIESGKLEQVDDELKKIKDPKLMTARQRAMYERSIEKDPTPSGHDTLLALPTGYKEKVMTAEALEKAQLKSQKRKQMADEKREKDKRKTMDRLLKKQETKLTKVAKNKIVKVIVPVISYQESIANGALLSYPLNFEFPMQAQVARKPPAIILCAICNDNRKRYTCSRTNVPLCSLKCYKSNQMQREISC
ncbi:INO80 complex subunit B [Contarinia nasturtii]|uniref:INO80 complex subunit B n=1 Tax=Contarinia nasturtii TaxID=265458 RepID=UPI0012D4B622|nr:INO80 complex subunit B [Contarinia nasturtii]